MYAAEESREITLDTETLYTR